MNFFLFLLFLVVAFRYCFPKHPYVINVYFGVPGSGKTTFAAYLTRWCNHEALPVRIARHFLDPAYLTRCMHRNTRMLWQLCTSFQIGPLHDWPMEWGYRFIGRCWAVMMLPVRLADQLVNHTRLFKRRIDVYSNVPITGSYIVDAKHDLGTVMLQNGKLIIDEAGVEFNNRDYKSFSKDAIYFFKYHRHYQLSVDVFSQSFEDMDVTIRRLARNFFVVKRSLLPGFILCRRIIRSVGIDDKTHQITDAYRFGLPVIDTKRVWCPPLWKLFNTYSCKELPQKVWEQW